MLALTEKWGRIMTTKIAINGFGRIGRNVLRALMERGGDDLQVVAINDLADPATNAHLFEFDSVHGRYNGTVNLTGYTLDVGAGPIRMSAERDPAELDWGDVDIALECTGFFKTDETAGAHLKNGSDKVLISAPGKGEMKTIVYGVNHDILTADDKIVSNASCTTNCLAPLCKALHEEFGILRGTMTTIHAYTGGQPTHDRAASDLARGRAAALSMVPTSTGAAKAIGLVMPELDGLIFGTSLRVPTPNVSCVDLTVEVAKETDIAGVNAALSKAARASGGVLEVEARPLVSVDFNHTPASSTVALDQTHVQNGTLVRILSWYDNEWGFSNRMLDTALAMANAK